MEAVVRLSHALGLKVVAEGVETAEQARILALLQCDTAAPSPQQASPLSRVVSEGEALFDWSDLELAGS